MDSVVVLDFSTMSSPKIHDVLKLQKTPKKPFKRSTWHLAPAVFGPDESDESCAFLGSGIWCWKETWQSKVGEEWKLRALFCWLGYMSGMKFYITSMGNIRSHCKDRYEATSAYNGMYKSVFFHGSGVLWLGFAGFAIFFKLKSSHWFPYGRA